MCVSVLVCVCVRTCVCVCGCVGVGVCECQLQGTMYGDLWCHVEQLTVAKQLFHAC